MSRICSTIAILLVVAGSYALYVFPSVNTAENYSFPKSGISNRLVSTTALRKNAGKETFKIGWISALTGPVSRYGADKAAILAVEDINKSGGINGKALELVMEDGRCSGKATATAAQKLINVDKVKFILGGHCSTETLTLAPFAEKNKVLVLASISTSPDITGIGDYVFRTSPVSTVQSRLIADHLIANEQKKDLAIIYEDTTYAAPIAEVLRENFLAKEGNIVYFDMFHPGDKDFRSMLTKIAAAKPEAIFISVQSPDNAQILMRQLNELGLRVPVYGNEVVGSAIAVFPESSELFEGLIFGEPEFKGTDSNLSANFRRRYLERFGGTELPFGFWTAESYDGVMLLSTLINQCGDDVESVRSCLQAVSGYRGASGTISIDENGDGIRRYVLKQLNDGRVRVIQ